MKFLGPRYRINATWSNSFAETWSNLYTYSSHGIFSSKELGQIFIFAQSAWQRLCGPGHTYFEVQHKVTFPPTVLAPRTHHSHRPWVAQEGAKRDVVSEGHSIKARTGQYRNSEATFPHAAE